MTKRAETRSVSIAAPPATVHAYLAAGQNLPQWAPTFAEAIRPRDGRWVITRGAGESEIVIAADRDRGTVDIVSARDHTQGAFLRVLPSGQGSAVVFTLLFAPDIPQRQIEAQMATVDEELAAIRAACHESRDGDPTEQRA